MFAIKRNRILSVQNSRALSIRDSQNASLTAFPEKGLNFAYSFRLWKILVSQHCIHPSLELIQLPKDVKIDSKSFSRGQNFRAPVIVHSNHELWQEKKELRLTLSSTVRSLLINNFD